MAEKQMLSYSTNWMGPTNTDWIAKHGDQWAAGRIDVYTGLGYPAEIALSPMHDRDWEEFSDWLDLFETQELWTLAQIVSEYEKTHPPIRWLHDSA